MANFKLMNMGGGTQAYVKRKGARELVVMTPGQSYAVTGVRKAYAGVFSLDASEPLCERADFKTTAAAKRWASKAKCR